MLIPKFDAAIQIGTLPYSSHVRITKLKALHDPITGYTVDSVTNLAEPEDQLKAETMTRMVYGGCHRGARRALASLSLSLISALLPRDQWVARNLTCEHVSVVLHGHPLHHHSRRQVSESLHARHKLGGPPALYGPGTSPSPVGPVPGQPVAGSADVDQEVGRITAALQAAACNMTSEVVERLFNVLVRPATVECAGLPPLPLLASFTRLTEGNQCSLQGRVLELSLVEAISLFEFLQGRLDEGEGGLAISLQPVVDEGGAFLVTRSLVCHLHVGAEVSDVAVERDVHAYRWGKSSTAHLQL